MEEKKYMEITAKVMTDETPLPLTILIKEAWLLVSGLQFLTRNPSLGKKTLETFEHIARQFQQAIVNLHPEANPLINMGWDQRFDVDRGDSLDINVPDAPVALEPLNNCWTIYADGATDDTPAMACIGRPQDWGDPRWMYRVYTLEAQGYRNTVHCWVDLTMKDHEHLQMFSSLLTQFMRPGWPVQRSGRDYLGPDDFWRKEWGEMPPFHDDGDPLGIDQAMWDNTPLGLSDDPIDDEDDY